jgi:hypothetical protein
VKFKDEEDIIKLLTEVIAYRHSSSIHMRIKIKEPESYDGTHNDKLLKLGC